MSAEKHSFHVIGNTFDIPPCLTRAGRFRTTFMCGILLIGHDRWLLQTRALILKSTRANVFTSDPKGFEEITSDQQIDLLILCHTLSEATRHSVSAEAHRRWPQVRVLQVSKDYSSSQMPERYADDLVPSCDPGELVNHARCLL